MTKITDKDISIGFYKAQLEKMKLDEYGIGVKFSCTSAISHTIRLNNESIPEIISFLKTIQQKLK